MRRTVAAALVLAALIACYAILLRTARAQESGADPVGAERVLTDAEIDAGDEDLLRLAILRELTLDAVQRDGSPWYVASCRRAHGGCPARARRMAALFFASGARHHVDPWTLAAIAMHESGGNPNVVGAHGELGVLQLHPGNAYGRMAARICAATPRACAAAIIDGGAALLAAAIRRCGDEAHGLSAYNSGDCSRRLVYAERIFARRTRMQNGGAP